VRKAEDNEMELVRRDCQNIGHEIIKELNRL